MVIILLETAILVSSARTRPDISRVIVFLSLIRHKIYNFLDCDLFKNLLFSTNSLAILLSDSLLSDSLLLDSLLSHSLLSDSLLSDSLLLDSLLSHSLLLESLISQSRQVEITFTFKVVVLINQSHSKL